MPSRKKRPHLEKKKVLFHQNNALVHTSVIKIAKINYLKFNLLNSLDLAPSDYFFFTNLKKNGSLVKNLPTMKRWSLRVMAILRSLTVVTINKVSNLLNIAEKSVSIEKKTTLRYFWVFIVSSGTSGTIFVL